MSLGSRSSVRVDPRDRRCGPTLREPELDRVARTQLGGVSNGLTILKGEGVAAREDREGRAGVEAMPLG